MAKIANVQEVRIEQLVPYAKNAKQHSKDQVDKIAESIKAFGFLSPCLIDGEYNIIAGHGRVMAARKLKMKTVPCLFIEGLTDEQRRAYILADNKLTELGEWDMDIVFDELRDLQNADFEISLTGFDEISDPIPKEESPVEEDFDMEVPDEPTTKRGYIYQLGNHRLMCGDSTNRDDMNKLMGGEHADISFTSPPYGASNVAAIRNHYVKGKKNTAKSFYNQHDDVINEWLNLMQKAYENMRDNSDQQFINVQMLADNKRYLMQFVYENVERLCDVVVWDKKKAPPQMAGNILNNQFEFIFVFGEVDATRTLTHADFHGNINNVIEIPTGHNEYADIHKAVFPVELPMEIIRINSKAQSVIDLFGGTGSTLIACEQSHKKCYMMELDPKYVDVIVNRWEQLTGEKAVLLNG